MVVTPSPVRPRRATWLTIGLVALGLFCLAFSVLLFSADPEPPAEAWPWPYVHRTVDGLVTTPMPEDLDR